MRDAPRDRAGGDAGDGLVAEVAAWLDGLDDDAAATLRSAPATTIAPAEVRSGAGRPLSTGGQRAVDALRALSRGAEGIDALRLGETLGEGGMGVIRLAEQVALGRTVAVKTLKPDRRDPAAALDLLREAWLTGALEHPNIVPVHHLGVDDAGDPVIVLKRIEGVSWDELLGEADTVAARFGASDLLAWNLGILIAVLNAVRFAHSRGVIHRDLKPANVMIGEFGEVYLLDWGLAVSLRDDGSGRLPLAVDARSMAGTPSYMAPEMLGRDGSPPLSERTDVYLVGAILHQLVTGEPPHERGDAIAVITSVILSRVELPSTVPAELARICVRAMAADPGDRHATAEALQHELREYLERRGATRLAELAGERLGELRRLVERGDGAVRLRDDVYRLFGACRFGFHEALAVWREHPQARAGLEQALVLVAGYELAAGEPRTALNLLGEVATPPAELLAQVRAAVDGQAARQAALERLRRRHDPAIGTRTRTVVAGGLGLIFTATPLVIWLAPGHPGAASHDAMIATTLVLLATVAGLGWWGRESMMKTAINQRAFATGLFVFVIQTILLVGYRQLGLGIVQAEVVLIGLWLTIAGMMAIGIDRRLAPAAVGYALAFAIASWHPAWRYPVMAAANLGFAINAVVCWRPARWSRSPAEGPTPPSVT